MVDQIIMTPTISHWLSLSAILFSIGLFGFLTRKNLIAILISVELMLNSTALNLAVFNHFGLANIADGQIFVIFIVAIAAAEVVVALAIFLAIFKYIRSTDVNKMNLLRG